jgi:hypothetical protein
MAAEVGMRTLKVELRGDDLVIVLTPEVKTSLGLRPGDLVQVARSFSGEVSLSAVEMDQQLRLERARAFLRHLR